MFDFLEERASELGRMLDSEVEARKADVDDLNELAEKHTVYVADKITEESLETREGDKIIQDKILETFEFLEEDILQHQQNRENYDQVRLALRFQLPLSGN